jgi:hypothetical protein
MPGFVASLVPTTRDHPNIVGWVSNMDALEVAIICYRIKGEWVPQYGVKKNENGNSVKLELPSCFVLDPMAAFALEDFYMDTFADMN